MKDISEDLRAVLDSLTPLELKALQRFNPLLNERNKVVRKLRRAGVKIDIITQISGIPRSTVHRVGQELTPDELAYIEIKKVNENLAKIYSLLKSKL